VEIKIPFQKSVLLSIPASFPIAVLVAKKLEAIRENFFGDILVFTQNIILLDGILSRIP